VADLATGASIDVSCTWVVTDSCDANLTVAVPAHAAITATMVSGNIAATGLDDDVSLQSTSGDVTASDIAGVVRLETTSGTISGNDLDAATCAASDVSGDVSLAFSAVPDSVSVEDTSGSVLVTVPSSGNAYLVTAHATSGSTTVNVPTNPSSTHVISITTVSGDISVEPGG